MLTYREAYARYQDLSWVRDPFGLMRQWKVRDVYDPLFRAELEHIHRLMYPRRRRIQLSNIPENLRERIQDKFLHSAARYVAVKLAESRRLERRLNELAPTVDLQPTSTPTLLDSRSTSDYGSQTNPARYAVSALEYLRDLLKEVGFEAEIRRVRWEYRTDAYGHGYHSGRWELWANAESWRLDALRRRTDLRKWVAHCKAKGVNPKVYNPWIEFEGTE